MEHWKPSKVARVQIDKQIINNNLKHTIMTAKELNRDIKRLLVSIEKLDMQNNEVFEQHKKEFNRLYYADCEFKCMNLQSVKIMLRLNLRYRFIALHNFGLFIEL